MIEIDFNKQTVTHTCSEGENACQKKQTVSFLQFKAMKYNFICEPCSEEQHDPHMCEHCSMGEAYCLTAFIENLERHEHLFVNSKEQITAYLPHIHKDKNDRYYTHIQSKGILYIPDQTIFEMTTTGITPRHRQADPEVWEKIRQYHILRRVLEHDISYEEAVKEPDLYEKAHARLGRKLFRHARIQHEKGIKHISSYLT